MKGPRIQALTAAMATACLVLLAVATTLPAQALTTPTLYAFLSTYRIQAPVFSPPQPIIGARLDLTDTRINGTWISAGGAEGPILVIENFQNGTMGAALLLPESVTGAPTWLSSIGPFGGTSVFGGTFFLGNVSGGGLDGKDQVGLSWISESELLMIFFPERWIGPPVSVEMKRLKDAL